MWFWKFHEKALGPLWLNVLVIALALLGLYWALRLKRTSTRLAVVFLIAAVLQFGFAFMEGRGINGLKDRIVKTGHAEFAEVAASINSPLGVLRNYEQLLKRGKLGVFANSKPPGQMMFYYATLRVSSVFFPVASYEQRLEALRTFASYSWPFVSCLVVFPLFFYARWLFDSETALFGCLLYIFIPAQTLITLHTDQVLFPLLFMSTLFFAAYAYQKDKAPLYMAAGFVYYLSVFFTFGLLMSLPFIVATGYASIMGWQRSGHMVGGNRRFAFSLAYFMAGFALAAGLFRLGLNYDFLTRYENAMLFHSQWKGYASGVGSIAYYSFLNTVEYATWIGIPLSIISIASVASALGAVASRRRLYDPWVLVPLVLLVSYTLITVFGRTVAETGRLWLFLASILCIVSAAYIRHAYKEKASHVLTLIVTLEYVTIYLIKAHQDFW